MIHQDDSGDVTLPHNAEVLQDQVKSLQAENESLKAKLLEVSEDRASWRHKFMLLSAQRSNSKI